MKVAVIQSSFLPWRGYFDFIDDVDIFIFYDDVQYSKGGWRNRNRIKCSEGLRWLTVPVRSVKLSQLICDTEIDYGQPWLLRQANLIHEAYACAPWFDRYSPALFELLNRPALSISELNQRLITWVNQQLDITTHIENSATYNLSGSKTDRLIELLGKLGATQYLSGPSAREYLEEEKFVEAGIKLVYKTYNYVEYPQLWGDFVGNVSIIDLLFNTGQDAKWLIKSRTCDTVDHYQTPTSLEPC